MAEFKRRLVASDALLIATPEHNFSLSACLKSCLVRFLWKICISSALVTMTRTSPF